MPDLPPTPVTCVGAVVVHEGHILVVKRGRPPGEGKWTLPGGRLEPDESIPDGVVRELEEETGITGEVGDLVGIAERQGKGFHYVIHDHWVTVEQRVAPEARDDVTGARWVDEAKLRELPVVPGTVEFLAKHGVIAQMRMTALD